MRVEEQSVPTLRLLKKKKIGNNRKNPLGLVALPWLQGQGREAKRPFRNPPVHWQESCQSTPQPH